MLSSQSARCDWIHVDTLRSPGNVSWILAMYVPVARMTAADVPTKLEKIFLFELSQLVLGEQLVKEYPQICSQIPTRTVIDTTNEGGNDKSVLN